MTNIRDIARQAGVSVATVSYVLNNGPRPVNAETRRRILQVMQELNYQPNPIARRLSLQRTDCLGLALAGLSESNFSNPFYLEYIRGISFAAEANGYNLLLLTNYKKEESLPYFTSLVRSHQMDGLLLLGSSIPDATLSAICQSGFPQVLIARHTADKQVYSISQDYRQGTYAATRHLLERGYRRIAFLGQSLQFSYGQERLAGYRQALADFPLPPEERLISIPASSRDDPTSLELESLMSLSSRPDAILTDRELVVLAQLRELGCRVPQDVALVGLDESETAGFLEVPLTALRSPKFEMGKKAVEMLLEIIAGETPASPSYFPMQLIVRNSSPQCSKY
jgi:DNA-binding LacI/PurR family transcriptional regulator